MTNRLASLLMQDTGRPLVIPYLTAGFPDKTETVPLLEALVRGGADAIELGLPFSDPLADGPVIQRTSQEALRAGIDHRQILTLVREFRKQSEVPLVVMGYLNPILAYGAEQFFSDAVDAGVDGMIIPDVPPEEAGPYLGPAQKAGLSWMFLAAPTSSDQRLQEIDGASSDLSYCVSVTGVTGVRKSLPADIAEYLSRASRVMKKPFVVGFGISTLDQIAQVSPPAVGVVVGSALLRVLLAEQTPQARLDRAESFMRGLKR